MNGVKVVSRASIPLGLKKVFRYPIQQLSARGKREEKRREERSMKMSIYLSLDGYLVVAIST